MAIVLGFNDYQKPSLKLAEYLQLPFSAIQIHHFPDGESKLTLPSQLPETVIICRSLNQPNSKLLELIMVAQTARDMGVKNIILIAPYLCYMRQDIAFEAGEVVSQKIVGKLIADYFDVIITVDPHLHRISLLSEAIPLARAISLKASNPMADFIHKMIPKPIIIGPDEESRQWVAAIAEPRNWEFQVGLKQRFDDNQVTVTLDDYSFHKKDLVIVDDIASTGTTLLETAQLLLKQEPASISVMVTHAFFVNQSIQKLKALGISNIWSSDSILHPTNAFSILPLIADSIEQQLL